MKNLDDMIGLPSAIIENNPSLENLKQCER